jgi:hypothetical protein
LFGLFLLFFLLFLFKRSSRPDVILEQVFWERLTATLQDGMTLMICLLFLISTAIVSSSASDEDLVIADPSFSYPQKNYEGS